MGNVTVNGKSHFGITSPFGGTKHSGLGRRNGTDGFEDYLGLQRRRDGSSTSPRR